MFTSIRLFAGRVTAGISHERDQFSKIVPQGQKADAIYRRYVVKFARINGVMKDQYYSTRYREKNVWRRNRILGESAYFKKWHYVKYCCQLIKHATKNNLTFPIPFNPNDTMALPVGPSFPNPGPKPDGYSEAELRSMQDSYERLEK